MKHFFMLVTICISLAPWNAFSQSGVTGLIINRSMHPVADRIADLLAMRWHFGRNVIRANLVIHDEIGGPASQKILFNYDDQVIKSFNIPRARLKAGKLDALAVEVYQAVVKADIAKKSLLLDRLSEVN